MYSPITGYIGACNVRPGNLVGKGESTLLSTVSAVDPIYINFQMNETDYLKIMRFWEDHKAEFKDRNDLFKVYAVTSDKVEYKYPGLYRFHRQGYQCTDRYDCHEGGMFQNPQGLIKPGTFTTIYLILMEREDGIVIPQSATAQIQGKNFAFLVDKDNKVNRVTDRPRS